MSEIKLRWYQQDAVDACFDYLREKDGNPLLEIPTGGGKTYTSAAIIEQLLCKNPQMRIVVLTHVKELVAQTYDGFLSYAPMRRMQAAVYSAGLGRKDVGQITFAGIQSVHRKADRFGSVGILIVDECHLIPHSNDGMYRRFISDLKMRNPYLRVIGLTATPFRTGSGHLCRGENKFFNSVAYKTDILKLIEEGFLSPLVSQSGAATYDLDGVGTRGGEYIQSELGRKIEGEEAETLAACKEIVAAGVDRKAWLVFASSVKHAKQICDFLESLGVPDPVVVDGNTDSATRDRIVQQYKNKQIKCLVNMGVFTTGFDAPHVDLVAVLRPTKSAGLWLQILGRGLRIDDAKRDCLVLDFGGNIDRHGPINMIKAPDKKPSIGDGKAPAKACPQCEAEVPASVLVCEECGHEFPPPSKKISAVASRKEVIQWEPQKWHEVKSVRYARHTKRGGLDSVRVDYLSCLQKDDGNARFLSDSTKICSEWICLDHEGFARKKAKDWVELRSPPDILFPIDTVEDLLRLCTELARPSKILVDESQRHPEVKSVDFENWRDVQVVSPIAGTIETTNENNLDSIARREEKKYGKETFQAITVDDDDDDDFFGDDLPF